MTYLTTITDALPRFTEAYKLGLLLLSVDQPTKPKDIAITQQVAALGER
jgi:hypothetical protein